MTSHSHHTGQHPCVGTQCNSIHSINKHVIFTAILALVVMTSYQHGDSAYATSAILPAHVVLKADSGKGSMSGSERRRVGDRGSAGVNNGVGVAPRRTVATSNDMKQTLFRLRPSPDDSADGLPVLPLKHLPAGDRYTRPSSKDLDPRLLGELLGSDFDRDFMSVTRPRDSVSHPNGTYLFDPTDSTYIASALPKLPGFRVPGSPDQQSSRITIKGRARRQAKLYLAAYSFCPVYVRWRNLGRRFWPRWIREGSCRGEKRARSCSVPPGMTCRPHRSATKTVLWWHCRSTGRGRSPTLTTVTTACGWIPIKYPVITACKCAC